MKRQIYWVALIAFFSSALGFAADSSSSRFHELMVEEFNEIRTIAATENSPGHIETMAPRFLNVNPTPAQPEGPFYPIAIPSEIDADLTTIIGHPQAAGTVVYVQGQVSDLRGNPIPGAQIEVWQACASGKYNHPNDPNTAPVDPNFQYYAAITCNDQGKYAFKTIIPGAYPASSSWWRPEHIHMMVKASGYENLTTQLYFNPSSFPQTQIGHYNATDRILTRLSREDQARLIVNFDDSFNGHKVGVFNISLKKLR
jgi:protocatechuate 3,4-dioxygenase, beta subunit